MANTDRSRKSRFHRASHATANVVGGGKTLAAVTVGILLWLVAGYGIGFPNQWFLTTNLVMTLAVFLTLLFLQHERRILRRAVHAKLDELIRSGAGGNHVIASEKLADELLEELRAQHREIVRRQP